MIMMECEHKNVSWVERCAHIDGVAVVMAKFGDRYSVQMDWGGTGRSLSAVTDKAEVERIFEMECEHLRRGEPNPERAKVDEGLNRLGVSVPFSD